MGGAHLMTDDLFIAAWKTESEKEIAELKKVKKKRLAAMKIHKGANVIMQQKDSKIQQFNSALSLFWSWTHYFVGTIYIWGR